MGTENVFQVGTIWKAMQNSFNIVLGVLVRPVVQQQLLAVFLVLLLSWLLPELGRRWWQRKDLDADGIGSKNASQIQRWVVALYHLVTPLLALVGLNIAIWLFGQRGIPNDLLRDIITLVLIWLMYRGLLTLVYARYGDAAQPYRNWIVTPLFLLLVLWQISAILPGTRAIVNANIDLGGLSVTLGIFVFSLIILYIFVVFAWIIKQIMMYYLPDRLKAEPGVIESIATLTRYTVLAVGILVSLSVLGLDFTSLAIVAGGLSVGIGIGLQDIVANFVSGLVLLFEQSLRPGDIVELEGRISQVENISLRATTIRTRTNEELIVPNSYFTTNLVKNFTKSERLVQVVVPMGVSYKSNPTKVRQLVIETVLDHPLVLPTPPPVMLFSGYGDSSLDFKLFVSINQPEMTFRVRSDLYYMLWEAFTENEIEIPFPQRDLNLGNGWDKLVADRQTRS